MVVGIRYVKSPPRSQYKYILSRTFGLRGRGLKYSTSGSVCEQRGLCRRKNGNGKWLITKLSHFNLAMRVFLYAS